mgnify:CR=1 FL=1
MEAKRCTSKAKGVGFLADVDQHAIRCRGAIRAGYADAEIAFSMLIDTAWHGCEELLRTPGVEDAF